MTDLLTLYDARSTPGLCSVSSRPLTRTRGEFRLRCHARIRRQTLTLVSSLLTQIRLPVVASELVPALGWRGTPRLRKRNLQGAMGEQDPAKEMYRHAC